MVRLVDVIEVEFASHVIAIEAEGDEFFVITSDGASVLRGGRLERVLDAHVHATSHGCLLTPSQIVLLDGTRIDLPPLDGARPSAILRTTDAFFIGVEDDERVDAAAVYRLDHRGEVVWRASTAPPATIGGHVSQMRRETGFQIEPMPPWRPQQWNMYVGELCVSGDRLVAQFAESPRSGIGICYGIDVATGGVVYTTPPGPYQELAAAHEPGAFLVGVQGYGAFETRLVDREGHAGTTWASHGIALLGEPLRLIELENTLPSRSHVAILLPDGRVEHGARLPGYYTSRVIVASDGRAVFWRDDALVIVSRDGTRLERVFATPKRGRPCVRHLAGTVPGRVCMAWWTSVLVANAWHREARVIAGALG